MNLLFIHGNFPGQFANIAPELASRTNSKVAFLTLAENAQDIKLPGVTTIRFALHRSSGEDTHFYLQAFEETVLKGQAVVRALSGLSDRGFVPDIVICHGGNGFGLYVKALLPNVKLISYMEWYFSRNNCEYLFGNLDINNILRLETRNAPILQELVQADVIVCPTRWQTNQFPIEFRSRIVTIFDGVNVDFFKPSVSRKDLILSTEMSDAPLKFDQSQLLMTYGTRGMEPLRGFPEFMKAVAAAQREFPTLNAIIFGRDRTAYSYEHHSYNGSWKKAMLNELKDDLDPKRLHFTGLLNYGNLVKLFQSSDLHCYFTRPYVVSWGVFQAAACGANLLVNNFPGVEEVFQGPPPIQPVNLGNQKEINAAVIKQLQHRLDAKKESTFKLSPAPNSLLNKELDLEVTLMKWEKLVLSLMH